MPNYLVRLPMHVEAATPDLAVAAMIDEIVAKGLRTWTYIVDNVDDNGQIIDRVGTYTGFGVSASPDPSTEDDTIGDDATDAELLQYADNLNDS